MSTALITRDDAALSIAFTETAVALKNEALQKAALIGQVSNADEQAAAVEAQQAIAQTLTQVEKARKACKEPVIEFGRAIDDAARAFVGDVKEEQLRLMRLVGDFQQLQQAKAAAAERARKLEEERIEREKQEAILKAAREAAERQRVLDEAVAAARRAEQDRQRAADAAAAAARQAEMDAKNMERRKELEAKRKELEAQAKRDRIEAERRRIELEEAQAKAVAQSHAEFDAIAEKADQQSKDLPPITFTPARAEGQRVTNDWEIIVSDIHLLYRHHPNCVALEPRLTEIKNILKSGGKVQGVIAKPVVKAGVTPGRARPAIEV